MDCTTEKQEFFSKGCFTGVRVRDNRESATALDFFVESCHVDYIM